jgi:Ribonuclease G/E
VSDYISDQLRAQSAALRNSIGEQSRLMVPLGGMASAEAIAAGRAKREAIAAEQLAAAMAEWEGVRARAQSGPLPDLLLALLDLHKPYTSFGSAPCCEHCMSGNSYEAEAVDWPCETYGIIKNGLA